MDTQNLDMERFLALKNKLTEKDIASSATQQSLESLFPMLCILKENSSNIKRMLDLGCGYGGLTKLIADFLGIRDVYGIDIDEERRKIAESRGIKTFNLNLESDVFPFESESVDLVTSFGVFEHLKFYDNPVSESYRILRKGGWILFSIPNLASWVNRLALLLGYQPRDVEISYCGPFGVIRFYRDRSFLYHIHAATLKAFIELLEYYGFQTVKVKGFNPYQNTINGKLKHIVKIVDKLALAMPSLCRRIIVLGRKG